ncbi:hypothetical protein [Falsirhodobacter algicola]|uniref:Uncharacterized protein n=1 Tax=Falsirhodobacter algicola TaxID=2692330 RepID=A0A8J8MS06_9RHOB|nr:hypothetical protein [Falsirhodobacter algicola]QUS35228.1 hypothetical protein GR316_02415 [Falsirhodobacter algicola]
MKQPQGEVTCRKDGIFLLIDAPHALRSIDTEGAVPGIVVARYVDVSQHLLSRVCPDRIVAPLFGRDFDAHELLTRLRRLSWAGRVDILLPELPRPAAVEEELCGIAGGCELHFIRQAW